MPGSALSLRLLCLHGFTGMGEIWGPICQDSGSPDVAEAALWAPDLLGHGPEPTAGASSFEGEVDRLAADARSRHAGPWAVAGYSLGGRLALGLLLRHPDLFVTGLLIGAHPGLESEEERRQRREADREWSQRLENEELEAFVRRWEALPLFASQESLPAERLAAQRARRLRHQAPGLSRSLAILGLGAMPAYGPRLEELSQPVLLMAGERDCKFLELARRMVTRLPRGELRVVTGAGHNLLLERPDAVRRALALLLTRAHRQSEPSRDDKFTLAARAAIPTQPSRQP